MHFEDSPITTGNAWSIDLFGDALHWWMRPHSDGNANPNRTSQIMTSQIGSQEYLDNSERQSERKNSGRQLGGQYIPIMAYGPHSAAVRKLRYAVRTESGGVKRSK